MIAEDKVARAARSTVRLPAPGPWMEMLLFRSGSPLCRSIVPATENPIVKMSEWLPASAARMAARRVPGPESASEVTVRLTRLGTVRSSSASSRGRQRATGRRGREAFRFRSHEEKDMVGLLSGAGLRYNENAIVAGAQT